jgi:hypothetical protein
MAESWTKPPASEFKTVRLFYPIELKWLSFLCDDVKSFRFMFFENKWIYISSNTIIVLP